MFTALLIVVSAFPGDPGTRARMQVPGASALVRVRSEDGTILGPDELELQMSLRDGIGTVWRPEVIEQRADGALCIGLDDGAKPGVLVLTRSGPGSAGARVEIQAFDGVRDLGEVRLAPPPLLVEGVVRSEDGTPAVHARVMLDRRWMGLRAGVPTWNSTGVQATTDAAGRFSLRAWVGTDELRVRAEAEGSAPAMLEVHAGGAPVELRLTSSGGIAGFVLVEADWGPHAIEIDCLAEGSTGGLQGAPLEADGSFVLRDLVPGSYRVRVRAHEDREPVLEFDALEVRSGEVLRDPRLANLDLRGRVRVLRLRLRVPGNEPLPFFLYATRAPGAEFRVQWAGGDGETELALATAAPALDVRLEIPGFRTVRLERVDGDRDVALEPGIPVRLALEGGLPPLPEGWTLGGYLRPVQSDLVARRGQLPAFDAGGELLERVPDPGLQQVVIAVHRESSDEDFPLPTAAITPSLVEVRAEMHLRVQLDRDALQEHLARLGKQR